MDETMNTSMNYLNEMSIQLNNIGAELFNLDETGNYSAMIFNLFKESISAMLETQPSSCEEKGNINAQQQNLSNEIMTKCLNMIQKGSAAVESALPTNMSNDDASTVISTTISKSKGNLVGYLKNMMYCPHGNSHNPVLRLKEAAPTYLTKALTMTVVDTSPRTGLDQSTIVLHNAGLALLHKAAKISSRDDATQEKERSALLRAAEIMFETSLNGNYANKNDEKLHDSHIEFLEGHNLLHILEQNRSQCSLAVVLSLNDLAFIKHQRQLYDDAADCYLEALNEVQDSRDYLPAYEFEYIRLAILCNLACSYHAQGNCFDAIQICRKTLHLILQQEKEKKTTVKSKQQQEEEKIFSAFMESAKLCLLYKLGLLHRAQCDFSQAFNYFKQYICRTTMSRTYNEEQGGSIIKSEQLYSSLDVVSGLNHFLIIRDIQESNPDSELSFAIKMVQKQWSECEYEAPDLALLLFRIGVILYESEEYDFSLHYFQKALRIERLVLEPFHVGHVCRTLNCIGQSYQHMGMLSDAMKHYNEALEVLMRSSSDHTSKTSAAQCKWLKIVPIVHYNMGVVQLQQRHHKQAIENFDRALALQRSMLVDNVFCTSSCYQMTLDYATMCYNVGTFLLEMGKMSQSIKCFELSHSIRQAMYGCTHILVSEPLYQIGRIYQLMGNPTQALQFLKKAAVVELSVLGPHDPDLAVTLYNIAQIYHHEGELSNALKVYGHVLSTVHSAISSSENSERTRNALPPELMPLNIILTMANINLLLRRAQDARSLFMEAMQLSSNAIIGDLILGPSNQVDRLMTGKFTTARAA